MKWVRLAIAAQVVVFAGWAAREEWRRAAAPVIRLETAPVDPRDLWSGQYMRLAYPIARVEQLPGFPPRAATGPMNLAVRLAPTEVRFGGAPVTVWRAVEVRVPPGDIPAKQKPADGVWVAGTWTGRGWAGGVRYGIERFYFNEKRKREFQSRRSGQVHVECTVDRRGRLALKRLIE
jgi:uncharacterized membrane-anchored protein